MNSQTEDHTDSDHSSGQGQDNFTDSETSLPANTRGKGVGPSDDPRTREDEQQEQTDYEAMPFDELWATLTDNQKRYVLARQSSSTKAAAAERIGMHRDTAYQWPDYVDVAVSRLVDHRKDAIREGLSDAAVRATQRLTELLDDEDSRTAIKAVQFALEQEIGKATQKQEIAHSGSIGVTDKDVEDLASALDHLGGNDTGVS